MLQTGTKARLAAWAGLNYKFASATRKRQTTVTFDELASRWSQLLIVCEAPPMAAPGANPLWRAFGYDLRRAVLNGWIPASRKRVPSPRASAPLCKLKAIDVIDVLSDLFILRGVPGHIRSDNVLHQEVWRPERQQISLR